MTGETRTHFLPGGAMLLAKFIRAPRLKGVIADAETAAQQMIKKAELTGDDARKVRYDAKNAARKANMARMEDEVMGPRPKMPAVFAKSGTALLQDDFFDIAERVCREEIVHSLLAVEAFPTTSDPDEKRTTFRVEKEHGYSGPADPGRDPSLAIEYVDNLPSDPPRIIVLDDTGNRFRKSAVGNPWPAALNLPAKKKPETIIVHKLHRPLPIIKDPGKKPDLGREGRPQPETDNPLWDAVVRSHSDPRVVITSVDDLRRAGAPISMGLSWERTALDLVWHLINYPAFATLRYCPRLIVRLGLDGALLWESGRDASGERSCRAWLVYDPQGIEGSFARQVPGEMVACGSAFTAAFVHHLAMANSEDFESMFQPVRFIAGQDVAGPTEMVLLTAIEDGLHASRHLLELGFGDYAAHPNYPGPELFKRGKPATFFLQPVRIIPGAAEPDRSYWRILDMVFENQTPMLHAAVRLTATGQKEAVKGQMIEESALRALKRAPVARFGKLVTHDRSEIEHYRSLHTLLRDYLSARKVTRPLSIAVFGAPGAGKGFGVKQVAKSLRGQRDCREVEELTFNLSLYQKPEELAGAFHLIRDAALRGKVALACFDEFDTALDREPLGWLRHFLAPMQDGEFLDRGAAHPTGQAIFIFAGGTCSTYREFKSHAEMDDIKFKAIKGPDFLSRLRHVLDIPSLNFLTASEPDVQHKKTIQSPGTFNPYGPIEGIPCEAAILLRRAAILQFNLSEKAPGLVRADKSLAISTEVLRVLLRLPQFEHGNRSFEALLEMSHLADACNYDPSLLPPPFQLPLHADPHHLTQLVGTDFPFPESDRVLIAQSIHEHYLASEGAKQNVDDSARKPWDDPAFARHRAANLEQADDIAAKLRRVKLWFRKIVLPDDPNEATTVKQASVQRGVQLLKQHVGPLARLEHDRWVAQKRRQGWIAADDTEPERKVSKLWIHNCIFSWNRLDDSQQAHDLRIVQELPHYLVAADYEIYPVERDDLCLVPGDSPSRPNPPSKKVLNLGGDRPSPVSN